MSLNQNDQDFYDQNDKKTKTVGNCFKASFLKCLEERSLGNYSKKNVNPVEFSAIAEDALAKKNHSEMKCELPGIPRSTFLVVFSPDGTKMASTHGNHNIYVTDIKTGKNIKTLVGHPRTPWCVAFHPTSNQIIASGCLGGQVRIWDLSGGSEVWTTESQTVIASIAFHPDDRVLAIATYNELYFWDWSKPEPFMHVATNNVKEKVRYVAFDKLGHKLITGISNSPQARWERVRAPVPIPRQIDRTANTYRRRITPRLIFPQISPFQQYQQRNCTRRPLSSVPERERRITQCYRNLVHEYELLVHRFLQIYRPPTMIDQGTDPMEQELVNNPGPSTSGTQTSQQSTTEINNRDNLPASQSLLRRLTTRNETSSHPMCSTFVRQMLNNSYHQEQLNRRDDDVRRTTECDNTTTSTSGNPNNDDVQETPENLTTTNRSNKETETTNDTPSNRSQSGMQTYTPCRVLSLSRQEEATSQTTPDESKMKHLSIKCTNKRKSHPPSRSSPCSGQTNAKKAKDNDDETKVYPSTSQSARSEGREQEDKQTSSNKWNRTVRKRVHSSNKYIVLSSDSSSSDEESIVKRRSFLAKKVTKFVQSESKKKLQTTPEPQEESAPSTSAEPMPSTSRNTSNFRDIKSLTNHLNDLVSDSNQRLANIQQEIERICNTCGGTISLDNSLEHYHNNASDGNTERPTRWSDIIPIRRTGLQNNLISSTPSAFCELRGNRNATTTTATTTQRTQQQQSTDYFEEPLNLSAFHPFDPPPEFVSIHPENIGIGNMYSNIVQELESSLNDVRNIRANNRLGETSDMLSSFSERLESIMNQSNAILRNLHTSIDTIMPETTDNSNQENTERLPTDSSRTHLVFHDSSFYVRDQRPDADEDRSMFESDEILDNNTSSRMPSTSRTAVASDHTYPRNPRTTRSSSTTTMTPLIVSLHFTVAHIRRQARLLRQQVESIEHIDRAMLEVAQLQMMRQMFSEIHRYFSNIIGTDRNVGVSSVRQMMAGTRISDNNTATNPTTNIVGSNEDNSTTQDDEPSTSSGTAASHPNSCASRTRAHKSFPRCIFLMHRPYRRPNLRSMSRDISSRRHIYRRSFSCRGMPRTPIDLSTNRGRSILNLFNPEALPRMSRRLEHLVMDQGRFIGRVVEPDTAAANELEEHIIMLRLNDCRVRMNRVFRDNANNPLPNTRTNCNCVTRDGAPRFVARQTLCSILDTLSRFVEANAGNTFSANFRTHIWDVVELSLLLSEILLLQIVDSIPPPTGMNLDPERESLSARIDQMCTRMLQSRLSVQSNQLTRSLRLLRLNVRHAAYALFQTYAARRNAILQTNNNADRRRHLLEEINVCLRNIRRHRNVANQSANDNNTTSTANANTSTTTASATSHPTRNWHCTINDIISRYGMTNERSNEDNSASNALESDEQLEESSDNNPQSNNVNNSSDSNDYNESDWFNNNVRRENNRTLYRSNNMNLLENNTNSTNSDSSPATTFNIPTIQVNDYSEFYSPWRPRAAVSLGGRDRLPERFSELRTHGLLRPRFLHPLDAVNNPLDADLNENQREQIYDSDIITSVTPNHRIQIWEFDFGNIPNINNSMKNIVVSECKIHNDASVDIATDGTMLVTLLPGGYLNVTNKLGVYSLEWKTLGQCLYTTSFEQNAVSVSLSPINRHLLVGLASRRVLMQNDKWTMARIFLLDKKGTSCGRLLSMRELEQTRDANYTSVNCIRWLPVSGQGLVYATNTGQLRILT